MRAHAIRSSAVAKLRAETAAVWWAETAGIGPQAAVLVCVARMHHWHWQSLVLSGLAHGALAFLPTPGASIRTSVRSRRHAYLSKQGEVSFHDRPLSNPAALGSAPTPPPPSAVDPSPGVGISAAANLKLDLDFTGPHSAERRWFLDRTRALRDELAARARAGRLDALGSVLEQIWSRVDESFAERRRQTFKAWDSLADDELGDAARELVVRFIRARCPPASGCAFDSAELAELNQARHGRAIFAPYGAAADAGR